MMHFPKIQKLIFPSFFFLFVQLFVVFSIYAGDLPPPAVVYRGDARPPQEIKEAGGFTVRPQAETAPNPSIYDHVSEAPSLNPGTLYISTSRIRDVGGRFAGNQGYVYHISTSENMLEMNRILQQYSVAQHEEEFVATRRIPWDQIIGWQYVVDTGLVTGRSPQYGPIEMNPDYRADLYDDQVPRTVAQDDYALAGFPPNHSAWGLLPWRPFAPSGCGGSNRSASSDLCESGVEKVFNNKQKQYDAYLKNKNTLSSSLKFRMNIESKSQCIDENDGYAEQVACQSAPIMRITSLGQIQKASIDHRGDLCLQGKKGSRDSWNWLQFVPCDRANVYQRWNFNYDTASKSVTIRSPIYRGASVSLYRRYLIVADKGSEGVPFTVNDQGIKNYFLGQEPFSTALSLRLRYVYKKKYWYPIAANNSLGTARLEKSVIYYEPREKKIYTDSAGGNNFVCLRANSDGASTKFKQTTWTKGACTSNSSETKWRILENDDNKTVGLVTLADQYLYAWQNQAQVFPLLVTSLSNADIRGATNKFEISPAARHLLAMSPTDGSQGVYLYTSDDGRGDPKILRESSPDLDVTLFSNRLRSFSIKGNWLAVFYDQKNYNGFWKTRIKNATENIPFEAPRIGSVKVISTDWN